MFSSSMDVRRVVFIEEQNVPEDLEIDDLDGEAMHVVYVDGGKVVGTLRLLAEGKWAHIGRVAVLKSHRRQGIGALLMERALEEIGKIGLGCVYLTAQSDKLEFYRRFGFAALGDDFDDAGIPHRRMELHIARQA